MNAASWIDWFQGKAAFITGGGSGINLGIATTLVGLGVDLTICSRNAERLQNAAERLRQQRAGAKVCPIAADVRDSKALEGAFARSMAEIGPADIVVCGAAGNFLSAANQLSSNGFRTVVDIDLVGSFNTARAAFDQLRQTRGVVLFISAGQAFLPYPRQVHAGAAKAGIDNMMQNLALEWGEYGIRCNSIVPGFIDGTEGATRTAGPALLEKVAAVTPLRRLGTVQDIANAVVFLSSPLASFITGTRLVVDGGHYLGGSGSLFAPA